MRTLTLNTYDNLFESSQESSLRYSLLDEKDNLTNSFMKCKDYLGDLILAREVYCDYEVYGYHVNTEQAYNNTNELCIAFSSDKDGKDGFEVQHGYFIKNFSKFNSFEKFCGLTPSKLERVKLDVKETRSTETRPKSCEEYCYTILPDPEVFSKTYIMSLWYLYLRATTLFDLGKYSLRTHNHPIFLGIYYHDIRHIKEIVTFFGELGVANPLKWFLENKETITPNTVVLWNEDEVNIPCLDIGDEYDEWSDCIDEDTLHDGIGVKSLCSNHTTELVAWAKANMMRLLKGNKKEEKAA